MKISRTSIVKQFASNNNFTGAVIFPFMKIIDLIDLKKIYCNSIMTYGVAKLINMEFIIA